MLPARAVARARTGDLAGARRDLATIRRLVAADEFREEGASEILHVEAELLQAQGRSHEAFELLRDYSDQQEVLTARRFSAGISQVTAEMQNQLGERRQQLETARANTALQADVIESQRWIVGIGVGLPAVRRRPPVPPVAS